MGPLFWTMTRRILFLLFLLVFALSVAKAQTWQQVYEEMMDVGETDDDAGQALLDSYELLEHLAGEPLDLNQATRDDLEQLPFLSAQQVMDIQEYLYRYGPMRSLGELRMIRSLDYQQIKLLPYFVFVNNNEEDTPRTSYPSPIIPKHTLSATLRVPFYRREGDRNGYLGYPYRHTLRYELTAGKRWRVGLVGAQDAGEPFFANDNRWGYDVYSYYGQLKNAGRLENLVVGKYRMSVGTGLVLGQSFQLGKLAMLQSSGRSVSTLRPHTSRSVADFLQGAAATLTLLRGNEHRADMPELSLTAFASYRKVDATLRLGADSTQGISSIVTDGYHRTATEMDRKNNVSEGAAGGHLSWRKNGFHAGVTAAFTSYDKPLLPDTSVNYRRYYPMGRRFWNVGADYGYTGPRFILHGEPATGDGGAWATINTVAFTPSPQLSLMALHRFYGKRYNAVHANGFSEGGAVRNESGLYAGVSWQAMSHLRVTAYTDYAYFPAAKYQASVSSDAWDNLVQVQYNSDQLSLTARYRMKMRGYDNSEKTALLTKTTHYARLSGTFTQGAWRFGATTDMALAHHEANSRGWLVGCHATYSPRWMKLTGSLAYFNTDDSDSKVYAYEQGLLYAYSYLSFQGKGLRWSLSARADLGKRLTLLAHLATTDYLDRDHISTGYQQIDRSSKTDLALQLKWRF